ncbi:MAG TPA: M50 family metallopeptidase [Thermoanaerobaculaceae bacterium]|nr:M50 family metallopeptidase [Thermoanaerobaculaceae bacterium]HRS16882.1 M50 family metallopeptidase [Thermoanaerobaculaceae bacterium]
MSTPWPAPLSPPGASRFDRGKAATLAAIVVPVLLLWSTPIVWPLKILVVFFHELSHGLAAMLTGGSILRIEVVAGQGGVCWTASGNRFIVLSAGYLGSLLWGSGVLLAATSTRRDRAVAVGLGAVIVGATLLWVRPVVGFGFGFHLAAGVAFVALGWLLPDAASDLVLKVFGVTSCLYVIPDIWSDTIARSHLRSDARMLAELTHVPTVVWGSLWILASLAVCASVMWLCFRRTDAPAPSPGGLP